MNDTQFKKEVEVSILLMPEAMSVHSYYGNVQMHRFYHILPFAVRNGKNAKVNVKYCKMLISSFGT